MKYALITGASSGIGRDFARLLDHEGYTCILVARREKNLIELNNELTNKGIIIVADLSDEKQVYEVYEKIKDLKIDLFINNAGLGYCGLFDEYDVSYDVNMIKVNICSMHILLKLMIDHMHQYHTGSILNVASIAGLLEVGPYMSTYYATKTYVVALTKSIQEELRIKNSPLYVGCLCPGPVKTEFDQTANVRFSLKGITSKQCVEEAYKGILKKKKIIIPTKSLTLLMNLAGLLPKSIICKITAVNQKKKIYK